MVEIGDLRKREMVMEEFDERERELINMKIQIGDDLIVQIINTSFVPY